MNNNDNRDNDYRKKWDLPPEGWITIADAERVFVELRKKLGKFLQVLQKNHAQMEIHKEWVGNYFNTDTGKKTTFISPVTIAHLQQQYGLQTIEEMYKTWQDVISIDPAKKALLDGFKERLLENGVSPNEIKEGLIGRKFKGTPYTGMKYNIGILKIERAIPEEFSVPKSLSKKFNENEALINQKLATLMFTLVMEATRNKIEKDALKGIDAFKESMEEIQKNFVRLHERDLPNKIKIDNVDIISNYEFIASEKAQFLLKAKGWVEERDTFNKERCFGE